MTIHSRLAKLDLPLRRSVLALGMASVTLATVGCSSPLVRPDAVATTDARIAATPNATPQRTITNFTESLRCMDDKLLKYEISGLLVGAQEVFEHNGEVTGTKDMLLTSLSTMSRKSKAFGIVTLSDDLTDVSQYHTLHDNKEFRAPDFFIRLSPAQIDKGVQTNQAGGGVGVLDTFELQHSRDRIASVVSLDMNLGTVRNLQLLPGIYSSNSIAVVRKGSASDIAGEIQKLGAVFRVTNDKSEGYHHSVRTLIELGAIEIVGRLTQIPYWECLDIESTNPAVQAQVQDWYAGLTEEERILFTQGKLAALDFYDGPVDGIDSPKLRTSIATYKADAGLIADGEIDFLMYYNLVVDKTPVAPQHLALLRPEAQQKTNLAPIPEVVGGGASAAADQELQTDEVNTAASGSNAGEHIIPLEMEITSSRGASPAVYRVGESVELDVSVSADAHVFCFYQQGDGGVIKLFPNRFRPHSGVSAGETLSIPGNGSFQIKTDRVGQNEQILCMASYEDIDARMPTQLKDVDLQPLPVESLEQIHGYYRGAALTVPLRDTFVIEVSN